MKEADKGGRKADSKEDRADLTGEAVGVTRQDISNSSGNEQDEKVNDADLFYIAFHDQLSSRSSKRSIANASAAPRYARTYPIALPT